MTYEVEFSWKIQVQAKNRNQALCKAKDEFEKSFENNIHAAEFDVKVGSPLINN